MNSIKELTKLTREAINKARCLKLADDNAIKIMIGSLKAERKSLKHVCADSGTYTVRVASQEYLATNKCSGLVMKEVITHCEGCNRILSRKKVHGEVFV